MNAEYNINIIIIIINISFMYFFVFKKIIKNYNNFVCTIKRIWKFLNIYIYRRYHNHIRIAVQQHGLDSIRQQRDIIQGKEIVVQNNDQDMEVQYVGNK